MKWEYKIVNLAIAVEGLLDAMGDDGWEAVLAWNEGEGLSPIIFVLFKRPKPK